METFFLPQTARQKVLKWSAICAIILIGISLLALNWNDLTVYEKACDNPVYVQGTVSVSIDQGSNHKYVESLSYEYNGMQYREVFYRRVANVNYVTEEGSIVSVAINPANPGELLRDMVASGFVHTGVFAICFGLALLVYGITIENSAFRKRRTIYGERDAYGKQKPRYGIDVLLLTAGFWAIGFVVMCIVFPNYFGLFH